MGQRLQVREGVGTAIETAEATWTYNLAGQVTTLIDGNGSRAALVYDGHGRQNYWMFPSTTRPPNYDDATPATRWLPTAITATVVASVPRGSLKQGDYCDQDARARGSQSDLTDGVKPADTITGRAKPARANGKRSAK